MNKWGVMGLMGAIYGGVFAGSGPANASTSTEARFECRTTESLRCWYLIGALGERPERVAFIARHLEPAVEDGKRRVEVMQIVEKPDFPERFSVWQLQFDCRQKKFRTEASSVGLANGITRAEAADPDRWYSHEAGRFGEGIALPFACDDGRVGAEPVTKLFMGDLYRAPDVINLFRRVYWENDDVSR